MGGTAPIGGNVVTTSNERQMPPPLTNVGSRPAAYGPTEWVLTLTIGLIWGSAYLWIAIAVDHLSPGVVAFGRVALGAAVLTIFPQAWRRIRREDWPRILVVSIAGITAPSFLFAAAVTELDSAVAGMITSGTPILSLVIATLLLGRLPGRTQTVGILVGFVGIIMMATPSLIGARAVPLGVGLVLLAIVGYGISSNLVVPLQQRYGGPAIALWSLIISSIILAPVAASTINVSEFTASAIIAVVILGVVGTGVARSLSTTLAGRVGGPRMTTTTYLIPIVAIVLGVVFRDEVVQPIAIVGVAVVLSGAYLATRAVPPE